MTDETRQSPAVTVSHAALPGWAISVRQPWAWAIIHAGKDIENRSPAAVRNMGFPIKGRVAIHAAKGLTREEYVDAYEFMLRDLRVTCPPAGALLRGGIIGSVEIVDVVKESDSRWFFGPRGLVLRDPKPCDFIPVVGALGLFHWNVADASIVPAPAKWMQPVVDKPHPVEVKATADLFKRLNTLQRPEGGDVS